MANTRSNDIETLERGNVYFFYRPRVDEEEPSGSEEIQASIWCSARTASKAIGWR